MWSSWCLVTTFSFWRIHTAGLMTAGQMAAGQLNVGWMATLKNWLWSSTMRVTWLRIVNQGIAVRQLRLTILRQLRVLWTLGAPKWSSVLIGGPGGSCGAIVVAEPTEYSSRSDDTPVLLDFLNSTAQKQSFQSKFFFGAFVAVVKAQSTPQMPWSPSERAFLAAFTETRMTSGFQSDWCPLCTVLINIGSFLWNSSWSSIPLHDGRNAGTSMSHRALRAQLNAQMNGS